MKNRFRKISAVAMLIGVCGSALTIHAEESTVADGIAFSDQVTVAEDLEYVAAIAWENVEFEDGNGATTADELYFGFADAEIPVEMPAEQNTESMNAYQQQVHDYLWDEFGLGGLYLYKPQNETMIRYQYEGIAAEDVGDYEFCDYDSYYDAITEKQIRYVTYEEGNPYAVYLKIFNEDSGEHDAFRVEWQDVEGKGTWSITKFDSDTVETPFQARLAAKYMFWDYTEFTVATESTSLNVRETPGGKVMHQLPKGAQITMYRHEQPAEDGTWFTLIAKYTEPDEEGWSKFEYYGWAATEFLEKHDEYTWVLCGGEANDRAEEKWKSVNLP